MKTRSMRVRVCSFLLAVMTSAIVLGGTVVGMQPGDDVGLASPTIAMETVTTRPSALG